METIISTNKRKVLALARATARRAKIDIPTEKDLKEQDGMYFIDLELPKNAKLPVGLTKNILKEKDKTSILEKAKKNPVKKNLHEIPVLNDNTKTRSI